jgi:CBS domain-containing protein
MIVKDAMTRKVTAATPQTTVRQIANKVLEGHYSGLPVIDENRKVIGVVTEFDIIRAVERGDDIDTMRGDQIMSKSPIDVELSTPIEDAIRLMTSHNIIRVPVTHEGQLVGILSRCDVIAAYLKEKQRQPFAEYQYVMDEGT